MKKFLIGLCAIATLQFGLVSASLAGTQQERMKTCNKDAKVKALKGDDRKAFMKSCLSTKKSPQATIKPAASKGGPGKAAGGKA